MTTETREEIKAETTTTPEVDKQEKKDVAAETKLLKMWKSAGEEEQKENIPEEAEAPAPADDVAPPESVAPKAEEPKAKEEVAPLPADLVERARKFGLTDDDLKEFQGHPGMLKLALAGKTEVSEAKVEPKREEKPDEFDALEKELDEKYDADSPSIKTLKALLRAVKASGAKISDIEKKSEDVVRNIETKKIEEKLDSLFAGSERATSFGAVPISRLLPGSSEMKNRVKVVEKMQVLRAGYNASGKNPSIEEVFEEALKMTFPEKEKPQERRERPIISKPTGRTLARREEELDTKSKEGSALNLIRGFMKSNKGD